MNTDRDIRNQIAFAREKGIKLGIQQGLEQGREEGRQEGDAHKSAEIARKMLADEVDINLISRYSGLSAEEIAALKETAGK